MNGNAQEVGCNTGNGRNGMRSPASRHDGVNAAWSDVIEREGPGLRAFAAGIAGSTAADDVLQDSYLAIVKAAPARTNDRKRFASYVTTTIYHAALSYRKRAEVEIPSGDCRNQEFEPADPCRPELEAIIERRELCGHLQKAIEAMPAAQRQAYLLAAIYDMSVREIADELGRNRHTVTKWLRKARRRVFADVQLTALDRLCDEHADDIRRLTLGDRQAGTVSRSAGVRGRDHLNNCERCRAAVAEHERLTRAIGLVAPPIFLLRELWDYASDALGRLVDAMQEAAHRLYAFVFGAGGEASTVASSWSPAAKVCAGAVCVVVAGGAVTAGVERASRDKAKNSRQASAPHKRMTDVLRSPLTSGPGSLPQDGPQPGGKARTGSQSGTHAPAESSRQAPKASPTEANFSPDNSGARVGAGRSQSSSGDSTGSGSQAPERQTKPPTGGSEEFQP